MTHFPTFALPAAAFLLSWFCTTTVQSQELVSQPMPAAQANSCPADDRDVYVITSRLNGRWPKLGPLRHASIAICPKGVSPIVYENGVPVSNCRQCEVYGTQPMTRGFQREGKRYGVKATRICGLSASTVLQRMRSHSNLNIPLLHDCRHDAIQVAGLRGNLFAQKLAIALQ